MVTIADKLPAEEVDRALDGWIAPTGWDDLDGKTQGELSLIIHRPD